MPEVQPAVDATAPVDTTPAAPTPDTPSANGAEAPKAKDTGAETRYQISRWKQEAAQAKAELERVRAEASKPEPKFDAKNDPDGIEMSKHIARTVAQEEISRTTAEQQAKYDELQQKQAEFDFRSGIEKAHSRFQKDFAIERQPTMQEAKDIVDRINEKGLTAEEVYLLTRQDSFLSKKPTGYVP